MRALRRRKQELKAGLLTILDQAEDVEEDTITKMFQAVDKCEDDEALDTLMMEWIQALEWLLSMEGYQ